MVPAIQTAAEARRPAEAEYCGGCELLELICVRGLRSRDGRWPPRGTVSVFDGKRGQIVYNHSGDAQDSNPCADAQGRLVLTGPHRAISAEGCVAMELNFHGSSQLNDDDPPWQEEAEATNCVTLWDCYSRNVPYNTPTSRVVDTCCGPVEVTYIVLSNAVEGTVRIKLARWDGAPPDACVHGRIAAHTAVASADTTVVVLFDDTGACARPRMAQVPLARSIIAAPVMQPVTVEVDLRSHSGDEIVRGSLPFLPEPDARHVQRLRGLNGEVEVTIPWLD